jgi:hypothetical protein
MQSLDLISRESTEILRLLFCKSTNQKNNNYEIQNSLLLYFTDSYFE